MGLREDPDAPIIGDMKSLALCLLAALVCSVATAQEPTGTLLGRVVDAETEEPLPDAIVLILGSDLRAVTDADGMYAIRSVPYGPFEMVTSSIGYRSVTRHDTLSSDSLRLDTFLRNECDGISISVLPPRRPGMFFDLPAIEEDQWGRYDPEVGRRSRTVLSDGVSERIARNPVWERGTDPFGHWRPFVAGVGAPAVYVGGVQTLSTDAVPLQALNWGEIHSGYVSPRYGASGAGVVALWMGGDGFDQRIALGASGAAPTIVARRSYKNKTYGGSCNRYVVERTYLDGEATSGSIDGVGALAARGSFTVDETRKQTASIWTGGDVNALGSTVQASGSASRELGAALGASWQGSAGLSIARGVTGSSRLASGRIEAHHRPGRALVYSGLDGATRVVGSGADRVGLSSIAAYSEVRTGLRALKAKGGNVPSLQAGVRVERFRVSTPLAETAAWAVQPRALLQLRLSGIDGSIGSAGKAYLYGSALAGPAHGASGIARRSEAGVGLIGSQRVLQGVNIGGAVRTYVREVRATGARGRVAGAEADLQYRSYVDFRYGFWPRLSFRGRAEWGDARFARNRWTLGASVEVSSDNFAPPLEFLGIGYGVYLDVNEGVGMARVVQLGAHLFTDQVSRKPYALRLEGIVRGRDAMPCAGVLGEEISEQVCPVPDVRAVVEIGI